MKIKKLTIFLLLIALCIIVNSCRTSEKVPVKPKQAEVKTDWVQSSPEEQGMDTKTLSKADNRINANYPNIMSLLVIRHGFLVYEKYYQGKTRDNYTHMFSVTKSVTSALIGIAIDQKFITGTDKKLADILPEYFTDSTGPLKKQITIRDALTMTGGIEPVDRNIIEWIRSDDWFKYAVNRPLLHKPGDKFDYNTGLTHLLSGVITKSTRMSTLEFADKFLLKPLAITKFSWQTDPRGYYGGGHLLYLTPRDMAKFGYLYLKNGDWNGNRIVPEEWVKESVTKKVSAGNGVDYGYLWWLSNKNDNVNRKSYFTFSALGLGGQRIDVIPDLDLITVVTANQELQSRDGTDTGEILVNFVLPSVTAK